jgi:hypothetical protein
MEFTDFLLVKLVVICSIAFIAGLFGYLDR